MYYLHKLELDEFGNEFARIVGKPSKTFERAVIRAKRAQHALVVEYPNNPITLFRNGIEIGIVTNA